MNVPPRPHPGMAKISLFGIAIILMLAGIAAWANSSHSAVEDPFQGPRVDPFSIMVNAKNLPSQESFNFEDERCLATPIQSMEKCHAFHAFQSSYFPISDAARFQQRQLLGETLGTTPLRAPGTGFFAAETEVRNRPSTPSGERETRRTHWKSPPLVGIFGASPHVGRKRECVVGATGIEPVTPTM